MKTIRSKKGPFSERPHFESGEIERMCADELRKAGLYPSKPGPVRIDRFIEKRFGAPHSYETLPDGVLGFTRFGSHGVEEIVISADLESDDGSPDERRLRSTLAHEAGHGLIHAHLFYLGTKPLSLFGESDPSPQILCRDVSQVGERPRGYDGRWWEFQANRAIGGLLLPQDLVERALSGFAVPLGSFGRIALPESKREAAAQELARVFNVNPAAARIRLSEIVPLQDSKQMSL